MSAFVHVAYVLYLVSYLMRDIMWLRVLTIVAAITLLPYYYLQPEPLWAPLGWNVLFAGINGFQVWRLTVERRPAQLSEDAQRLHLLAFRPLTGQEMKRLVALARWTDAAPGERIIEGGTELDRLLVIFSGRVSVEANGRRLAELRDGQFVGEMSFLAGGHASADVVAIEPTRTVAWTFSDLADFLGNDAGLRATVQAILGSDVVEKLRKA